MAPRWDVAVVGAGPGGSTAAARLAKSGLEVLLLDRAAFPRDKTCGDALSPPGLALLDELGLGPQVRAAGRAVGGVRLVSPAGLQVAAPLPGGPALVVRRLALDDLLRRNAEAAGARFEPGVRVRALESLPGCVRLSGEAADRSFSADARLVVLAVGASLPLVQAAGLGPRRPRFAVAARQYVSGLRELAAELQIRFDGVPLPGYAWVFPLSPESANLGAGFFDGARRAPASAAAALEGFLAWPGAAGTLRGARREGPLRGYPLRMDFDRSEVAHGRCLAVGEAAGLVNPFTGEGIDLALESARLAARALAEGFERGDPLVGVRAYARRVRHRYRRPFRLTRLLRTLYMNPRLLDPLMRACAGSPDSLALLLKVLVETKDVGRALDPRLLLRALRAARRDTPQ